MDSVPFTLFFMVFILGFQENMVHPYVVGNPIEQWTCSEHINYCNSKKPHGYPSKEELIEMFLLTNISIQPVVEKPEDRVSAGDTMCGSSKQWIHITYLIKDVQNKIRYSVYHPEVYTFNAELQICHATQSLGSDLANKVKCEQKYTEFPVLVLSDDLKRLQSAKVKLPTICAPTYIGPVLMK